MRLRDPLVWVVIKKYCYTEEQQRVCGLYCSPSGRRRGGKVKYRSRDKAEACAVELQRVFAEQAPQRAYACPRSTRADIPHWHLTRNSA